MRVLLIYSNRSRIIEPVPPVGLSYVASAVRRAGHDVRFLDYMVAASPGRDLTQTLARFQPDVVGVSVRNIDNMVAQCAEPQTGEAVRIITEVRRLSNAVIVVGGPAVSILAQRAPEYFAADFAVVGEGESALVELLDALERGESDRVIAGVCRCGDKSVTPARATGGFGPSGMEDWVDWKRYERAGGTFAIHTKRGCPMACIYCNYPGMEGRVVRCREPGEVVDEIERIARDIGPRTFEFTDTTFNMPEDHAIAICEAIIRRRLRVNLSAVGVNPRGLTPRLVELMKRAGFLYMAVSADAGNDEMLRAMRKDFTVENLRCAALAVKASGIRSAWFFLFGAPGETLQTADETLDFAVRHLNAPGLLVVAMAGLRVLPSTPLAARLLADGSLGSEDELASPRFYFSPGLDERELLMKIQRAIRYLPALVHGGEESGSKAERAYYFALRLAGLPPPFMRFLPDFLRCPPLPWLRRLQSPPGPDGPC